MTTPLLSIRDLSVTFPAGSALVARLRGRHPPAVRAVDRLSLDVSRGSSLGIVGESGCGKSTLARALVGLVPITSGSISFDGLDLASRRDRGMARRIQMVFQDPASSLNPRRTVGQTLGELLRVHRMVPRAGIQERAEELLALVELPASLLGAYPRRLSGGQRQRVGIARALALQPEVLIADEAVAALDVSVQASILDLLDGLRRDLGLTLLFISHDLGVVRHLCERVVVMYLGRIVEDGSATDLFADPRHPYTAALLAAAPRVGVKKEPGGSVLSGEPPSPLDLPEGCRFHPRCPLAAGVCRGQEPQLAGPGPGRRAACHFAWESPVASEGPAVSSSRTGKSASTVGRHPNP